MVIKFRPHHFLCTLGFQGKGYSPGFIRNYKRIAAKLRTPNGEQQMIEVVEQTDSICTPCPHRRGELCASQAKITLLDKQHATILNLKPGERLTWGKAKQRIKTHMSIERHRFACAGCEWQPYGICEKALQTLLDS